MDREEKRRRSEKHQAVELAVELGADGFLESCYEMDILYSIEVYLSRGTLVTQSPQ